MPIYADFVIGQLPVEQMNQDDKWLLADAYSDNACFDCGMSPNDEWKCVCGCEKEDHNKSSDCMTYTDAEEAEDWSCWNGYPRFALEAMLNWQFYIYERDEDDDVEFAGIVLSPTRGKIIYAIYGQPLKTSWDIEVGSVIETKYCAGTMGRAFLRGIGSGALRW